MSPLGEVLWRAACRGVCLHVPGVLACCVEFVVFAASGFPLLSVDTTGAVTQSRFLGSGAPTAEQDSNLWRFALCAAVDVSVVETDALCAPMKPYAVAWCRVCVCVYGQCPRHGLCVRWRVRVREHHFVDEVSGRYGVGVAEPRGAVVVRQAEPLPNRLLPGQLPRRPLAGAGWCLDVF